MKPSVVRVSGMRREEQRVGVNRESFSIWVGEGRASSD